MMAIATVHAAPSLFLDAPAWWLWLAYLVLGALGLVGSAIFSGLETAIYSISRLRLTVRQGRGDRLAAMLREETADSQRMISTLLISNNICNFAVSFAFTAIGTRMLGWGDGRSIVVQALVLTPLLFIFGETIPKEVGRSRADVVAYQLAPLLRLARRAYLFTGVLWFFHAIGRWLSNRIGSGMTGAVLTARARIASLIEESVAHGTLSPRQTDIIDRALSLRQTTAEDCMIPWSAVQTLKATDTLDALRRRHATLAYSRYPVIDEVGKIIGAIDLIDLIAAGEAATAGSVARAVPCAPESLDVRAAIARLRKVGSVMGIVGSPEAPRGLITLRDLVEPLMAGDQGA